MTDILSLARSSEPNKLLDRINEYMIDGIRMVGVAWNTRNYYSVRDIVGETLEGLVEAKLFVYGREIKFGDFIYTDLPLDRFEYHPTRTRIPTPEENIFVLSAGTYTLGFVE